MTKKNVILIFFSLMLVLLAASCGNTQDVSEGTEKNEAPATLTYAGSMELDYAKGFSVDYYDGGYSLIELSDGSRFLVVPEDADLPGQLEEDVVILRQPIDNIYLVASAVMDMFVSIDAIDHIRLSGTKKDGWYIKEAQEAMERGDIAYAGKYNMPDYETIVNSDCRLAIESTMILHSPEVKEKLEGFQIPVLVDHSSYETHPLGRTEWVKLYGVLMGKEAEAEAAFEEQKAILQAISGESPSGQTVAFFFITSNGTVNVRKSGDYVPKMIELAGGRYIFEELGDDSASSSVNMTMEEFYANAKDADYLIYNSTIDGELGSVDDLLGKSPLLKDFQAVQTGRVFCTTQNFYQESMQAGTFIRDVHTMLTTGESENAKATYLYRLQ